jgi:Flp pilus assembly protein CpaB
MFVPRGPLRRAAARLSRWPRRLAAVLCLLLAAGSALAPTPAPRAAAPGPAAALRPGQVAVPVAVAAAQADFITRGDRVGVLAAFDPPRHAVLIADHLRVLSVRAADAALSSDATAVVVLATDRAAAVALAQLSDARPTLILDGVP